MFHPMSVHIDLGIWYFLILPHLNKFDLKLFNTDLVTFGIVFNHFYIGRVKTDRHKTPKPKYRPSTASKRNKSTSKKSGMKAGEVPISHVYTTKYAFYIIQHQLL